MQGAVFLSAFPLPRSAETRAGTNAEIMADNPERGNLVYQPKAIDHGPIVQIKIKVPRSLPWDVRIPFR